jgi:hypothetical protein
MVLKHHPNALKRGPNTLKTARNNASFRENEAIFSRKCFADTELSLCHRHVIGKPCGSNHLRTIMSFDPCQSIHKNFSDLEMRPTHRSGKNSACYTRLNNTARDDREPVLTHSLSSVVLSPSCSPVTRLPMTRFAYSLLVAFGLSAQALAQPVNLTEKVAIGDRAKYTIELDLKGNLLVVQEGAKQPVRLEAKARLAFAERVVAVADGLASTSARSYSEAVASAVVAGEKSDRKLPAERRVIVARRKADGLVCFSPTEALTRDDLDLVTEHFNPQCLPGLLPGKIVNVGDTWTPGDNAVQAACLFHGVLKNALIGKLIGMKDGVATFTIEGVAEGIENGAKVALTISATGTFDVAASRVVSLDWKQKDEREQGAVNPASQVEATVTLKRESLEELPKELSDEALGKLPDGDVPPKLTLLRHSDQKGRYHITHARDWYLTGQTDTHTMLRLVEKGEFVAQATVMAWRKVDAGKHSPAEEFKKAVAIAPGWEPGKTITEGELPAGEGRWLFRLTVEGKIDGQPVVQTFYLLAGPQGDQVAVAVVAKPDKLRVVGTRDADLVKAIEFGRK